MADTTTEWISLPDRPDRGHRPHDTTPGKTRCGLDTTHAVPNPSPSYLHTACLTRPAQPAQIEDLDDGLFDVATPEEY